MNIDFHTHVKLSKSSQFMPAYFEDMINEAKEAGLTAICMTEHFNTSNFIDIYDCLNTRYPYQGNYFNVHGLKFFYRHGSRCQRNRPYLNYCSPRRDCRNAQSVECF